MYVLEKMSGTVISPAIINDPGLIHILCNFLSSGYGPKQEKECKEKYPKKESPPSHLIMCFCTISCLHALPASNRLLVR